MKSIQHFAGWVFVFLLISIYFFRDQISYNEMDVVPFALSVFNEQWLSSDWYLNLTIQYRFLFSNTLGWMVEYLGYNQAIIYGRLISYALMSFALNYLIWSIKPDIEKYIYFFSMLLFFQFFGFGYGSGEWIVGGIETKVFAYACAIVSLALFLNSRVVAGSFFAGLSISFHLLVGIYHVFCLLPIAIVIWRKLDKPYIEYLIGAMVLLIGAGNGILGIFSYWSDISGSSDNTGWEFYVNFRVAHHVLPTHHYYSASWVIYAVLTLINILFLLISRQDVVKRLSMYALFSSLITLFGLVLFLIFGPSHIMRFYFFRYTDVILPLMTLIAAGFQLVSLTKSSRRIHKSALLIVGVASSILLIPKFVAFVQSQALEGDLLNEASIDKQLENWVKQNTDNQKVFLVPPNLKMFYINFDRSMFVSFKHTPQNNEDLKEWHNRLKLINEGQEVISESQVIDSYKAMSQEQILKIKSQYPNVHYMLQPLSSKYDFRVLYTSDKYKLYYLN